MDHGQAADATGSLEEYVDAVYNLINPPLEVVIRAEDKLRTCYNNMGTVIFQVVPNLGYKEFLSFFSSGHHLENKSSRAKSSWINDQTDIIFSLMCSMMDFHIFIIQS